jgi:uncharacterized protein
MKQRILMITFILLLVMLAITSCKKKTEHAVVPKYKPKQTEQIPEVPTEEPGKIKVALIIDDFGSNGGELLQSFCKLDQDVSFAIIPGLEYSKTAMKKAADSGHETIIHIPMEPIDYPKIDPGKNAILLSLSTTEIADRVEGYIDALPYCIGANNHMGSAITKNMADMKAVLQVLKKHDMFFIDSATIPESIVAKAAQEVGVSEARRRIFLDMPDTSPENTKAKIKELEKIGAKTGTVIVIGHCHNEKKLEQIRSFIQQCKDLGYQFIPVSKSLPKHPATV